MAVSLPQSRGCEAAAVHSAAEAAAAGSVSAEPASVWSGVRHPGPTKCVVSYTNRHTHTHTHTHTYTQKREQKQYWAISRLNS